MKITFVVDDFHGGAGNVAQLLAMELSSEHEVSIVLCNPLSESRYDLDSISVYRVPTTVSGKHKIIGLLRALKALRHTLVKEIGTDLVISFINNINCQTCLALWFSGIPIIVSERSNPLVIPPRAPWDKILRIAYRRADVVTVQFDAFRTFEGGRFSHKCITTPNIIDIPSAVKQDYKAEKVRFVTFGRLVGIKRMDLMVRMFAEARRQNPNIELHIFGAGAMEGALRELIGELGLSESVFMRGYCDDTHGVMPEFDVYLMTSRQEGFPNSLCEAMALGLPSVSFLCHDGIADLCADGRGVTVAEGDEVGFISEMLRLASDEELRREMGARARSITEKYGKESVMSRWQECISLAVAKRAKRTDK